MSWEPSIVRFNFALVSWKQSASSPFGFQIAHIVNLETSHLLEVIFSLAKLVNVGFT